MMKLGLFLFLQLKDGTLTSRTPALCWTSQALCVWPRRIRRGRSHHSSCGGSGGSERSPGPGDTHTPSSSLRPQVIQSFQTPSKVSPGSQGESIFPSQIAWF